MEEQFANLGTAAVMDADKLAVGSYVKIDDQLFVVEKIVDDLHVYFRPVIGWELWRNRWSNLRPIVKIILISVLFVVGILMWWSIWQRL